jgi:hypothetical protein
MRYPTVLIPEPEKSIFHRLYQFVCFRSALIFNHLRSPMAHGSLYELFREGEGGEYGALDKSFDRHPVGHLFLQGVFASDEQLILLS